MTVFFFFFQFSLKTGFDIQCKEAVSMKCQSLFSAKNKKKKKKKKQIYFKLSSAEILPSMLCDPVLSEKRSPFQYIIPTMHFMHVCKNTVVHLDPYYGYCLLTSGYKLHLHASKTQTYDILINIHAVVNITLVCLDK